MQILLFQPKEARSFGCFVVRYVVFICLFTSLTISYAQDIAKQPIDGDYLIDLHKSPKPVFLIQPIENLAKKIDYRPKFIKVNYKASLPIVITPMQLKKKPTEKIFGNYLKAGIGNYFTSYVEAFFNTKRSEKYAYSLHFRHLDSRLGVVDRRNSGNSQNELLFNFRSYLKKGVFLGNIGLQTQQWHFYGYRPFMKEVPPSANIRQNFYLFDMRVGYTNKYLKGNKHSYDANVGFHHLIDHYSAKESELEANFSGKTSLNHANRLYVNAEVSSSERIDTEGGVRRNLIAGEIYHQYTDSKVNFQIGGKAVVQNDTLKDFKQFHLYPKLYFSVNIFKGKFNIFSSLEGNMQKRRLRDMISENPFLTANVPLLHTNKTWEATLGVQTQLLGSFNWQASISYGNYQNLHFFMNNSAKPSQFTILYETNTIPVINFTNEAIVNFRKIKTKLRTEWTQYQLASLAKAWHRPLLTNTLSVSYQAEKFSFGIDFYYLSQIAIFDIVDSQIKDLQAITDLNLKIDYKFSPQWLLFLKGNNLLAQRYQRYQYYDVSTAQVIAGVGFTF
jgi:hypothetical protein